MMVKRGSCRIRNKSPQAPLQPLTHLHTLLAINNGLSALYPDDNSRPNHLL